MSESKTDTLSKVGTGCLGLYALLVLGSLVVVVVSILALGAAKVRAQQERNLQQADSAASDSLRAELLARSAVDRLAAELGSGLKPSSPLKAVLGGTHYDGEDTYELTFEQVEGAFVAESTGRVLRGLDSGLGFGTPRESEGHTAGECVVKARLNGRGRVLTLEARDTTPPPPRPRRR